ncbi:hypothetical protein ABTE09_19460, partial [Acinetobacter baumannii]
GFLYTDPGKLLAPVRELLANPGLARDLGRGARRLALERFGIGRFARDWEETFTQVAGRSLTQGARVAVSAGVRQ